MGKELRFFGLRGCTGGYAEGRRRGIGSGCQARSAPRVRGAPRVVGRIGCILSGWSFLLGCGPLGGLSSELYQERPHYGVLIDPDRNGSEVIIKATVFNTSDRAPLDIRQAQITYLSASTIEIPPHQIDGPCVKSIVLPQQSCTFSMRYEVGGARQGAAFWEFVLDGQVVQFTLKE